MLGGGDRRRVGRMAHGDASGGGGGDVDRVVADTRARDDTRTLGARSIDAASHRRLPAMTPSATASSSSPGPTTAARPSTRSANPCGRGRSTNSTGDTAALSRALSARSQRSSRRPSASSRSTVYGRPSSGWATLRTGTPHGVRPATGATVGMAVDRQVGAATIDRLGQQVAAEEREDLRSFALHGLGHRGVVGEGDTDVAVQVRPARRRGRPPCRGCAGRTPSSPARRTPSRRRRGTRHRSRACRRSRRRRRRARSSWRRHRARWRRLPRGRPDVVGHVALVVVVAEHGDDRAALERGQLAGEDLCLLARADPGEVAGQQQHVGLVAEALAAGPAPARSRAPTWTSPTAATRTVRSHQGRSSASGGSLVGRTRRRCGRASRAACSAITVSMASAAPVWRRCRTRGPLRRRRDLEVLLADAARR